MDQDGPPQGAPSEPRLRVRCAVQLRAGEQQATARARDVGLDGMQLLLEPGAREWLSPGAVVGLEGALPFGAGPLRARARVAWIDGAEDHRGAVSLAVGLQFQEVAAAAGTALRDLLTRRRTTVLLLGLAREVVAGGLEELEVLTARSVPEALEALEQHEVGVLAVGSGVAPEEARALLSQVVTSLPRIDTVNVVLSGGSDLALFQELVDHDRLFYLARRPVSEAEVRAIVLAAVRRYWALADGRHRLLEARHAGLDAATSTRLQAVLEVAGQLASRDDLATAASLVARGAAKLVSAARTFCLLHDAASDTLWSREGPLEEERRESAVVGLSSFVVRTGEALRVDRVDADPRFDRAADDPEARGDERLLAVPVAAHGGQVLAVLTAVREGGAPPFAESDLAALRLLAEHCGPPLEHLALKAELREREAAAAQAFRGQTPDLFREEALDHWRRDRRRHGSVLHLSPGWTRATYWLLLAMVAAGLIFISVGRVHEYAEGPAVVRVRGRTSLTAVVAGTVKELSVQPGQRVRAGEELLRFHDAGEVAELRRLHRDFELKLVARLRDPSDPATGQALGSLLAERKVAEARLAERTVLAPHAGVVGDLRVRQGQHVNPGDSLLSLTGDQADHVVVVMLPGQYRPQLRAGMLLRLELAGYDRTFRELEVGSIGDEVIGPKEAQRFLGPDLADAVTPAGPVVLLQAPLRARTFSAQGRTYSYHDGMLGVARVRVRSEPILFKLVPGLKELSRAADDS